MAKLERTLKGDMYALLEKIETGILAGSISATLEDKSDFMLGDVKCAVRVYERYSFAGGNRVSLSLTAVQLGDEIKLSAITSGGSQAVLFKLNTLGEKSFLRALEELL